VKTGEPVAGSVRDRSATELRSEFGGLPAVLDWDWDDVAEFLAAAGLLRDDVPAWEWGACCRLNGSVVPGYWQGSREFAERGLADLKRWHPDRDVVLVRRRAAIPAGPWGVFPGE
jgi:hypothetical protein